MERKNDLFIIIVMIAGPLVAIFFRGSEYLIGFISSIILISGISLSVLQFIFRKRLSSMRGFGNIFVGIKQSYLDYSNRELLEQIGFARIIVIFALFLGSVTYSILYVFTDVIK